MPIRRSPNGARHVRPQPGRNRPERVVAVNRNAWSQSVGIGGRNHPVRAPRINECNHIDCWDINALSQAPCVGDDSFRSFSECSDYLLSLRAILRAANVKRVKVGEKLFYTPRSIRAEFFRARNSTMKCYCPFSACFLDSSFDCDLICDPSCTDGIAFN